MLLFIANSHPYLLQENITISLQNVIYNIFIKYIWKKTYIPIYYLYIELENVKIHKFITLYWAPTQSEQ